MAITILPQANPSAAASLAGGFGTGLGSGLQALADMKMQQMQQQKQASQTEKGLLALPGMTPESAKAYSQLPAPVLQQVIKQQLQAPQQQAYGQAIAGLLESMGGSGGQGGISQGSPGEPSSQIQGAELKTAVPDLKAVANSLRTAGLNEKQAEFLTKQVMGIKKEQAVEKRELAKQKREEIKEARIEQHKIDKETLPVYQKISKEAEASKDSDRRLDRMETLIKRGNLTPSGFYNLLEKAEKGIFGFGINLKSLQGADSQEFEKLSTDFIKNAKDYFGSRLTDVDLKAFLQTVPTLAQSDAGKMRVIRNLKAANDIARIKKKTTEDIIKANGGKRPSDLDSQIDKLISPQIDALAKEWKKIAAISEQIEGTQEPQSWDFVKNILQNQENTLTNQAGMSQPYMQRPS